MILSGKGFPYKSRCRPYRNQGAAAAERSRGNI
jgi:hypothetical protein